MLSQLIENLRARGPLDRSAGEMHALLAAGARAWEGNRRLPSRVGAYTRTCAYRDDAFEVVLLNWAPGSASPIHDHGDQHCWMIVLSGALDVDDYKRLDRGTVPGYARVEPSGFSTLGPGGVDLRSGRFSLHRVSARADGSALSLHIYSAPLQRFFVYDQRARRCDVAYGAYDEVLAHRALR
ncbi:MAG: cysteine dioxygenase family protein [Candidatus Eremiobacteraeota bacterium]|nr:cysteine dioxygenase family protein [Candidatus Eremiobacteraeota bacterium]